MKRTLIRPDFDSVPEEFHPLLKNAAVYDSSCSREAQVLFIDKDCGYFLKSAPVGSLRNEAILDEYFHKKGLSSAVLAYRSWERDWLLTERVCGEDCTFAPYLDDPRRLCDTIATLLRTLHETETADCPIQSRMETYLQTAVHNYENGIYDASLFPDNWGFASADEAWRTLENGKHRFEQNVLLHGDYCLPNILLDNWRFSGFIDLGNGGVGDRHVDLFWGAWTLNFNLKTDAYRDRFFDAYGRDKIDPDRLRTVAAAEMFG